MEPFKRAPINQYSMMKQSLKQTLILIRSDFRKRCEYENKAANIVQVIKFIIYPAFMSIVLYRCQRFFYTHHLSFIAYLLKVLNQVLFSVSIDSEARIDERMMILHASYIVIGPKVTIGKDAIFVHHNSIIPSPFYLKEMKNTAPQIGDNIILGGGAQVTGDVTLGDDVQVSMNASVEESFGDKAILFGVPARNLNQHTEGA